jgi:hypothetical protein
MSGIALLLTAIFLAAFFCVRYAPRDAINLPQREYWLASERRADTMAFLFIAGLWLACINLWFLLAVHVFVVAANSLHPPQLSPAIWTVTGALGVAVLLWSFFLFRRFTRTRR